MNTPRPGYLTSERTSYSIAFCFINVTTSRNLLFCHVGFVAKVIVLKTDEHLTVCTNQLAQGVPNFCKLWTQITANFRFFCNLCLGQFTQILSTSSMPNGACSQINMSMQCRRMLLYDSGATLLCNHV